MDADAVLKYLRMLGVGLSRLGDEVDPDFYIEHAEEMLLDGLELIKEYRDGDEK